MSTQKCHQHDFSSVTFLEPSEISKEPVHVEIVIELHKFCSIVGKLVPSHPDKRVFLIHNPVELALIEPNTDLVIYYASPYQFILDISNDKVSVKPIAEAIPELKFKCIYCYFTV
ncbi:hypothetical protein [Nostoc sp.]